MKTKLFLCDLLFISLALVLGFFLQQNLPELIALLSIVPVWFFGIKAWNITYNQIKRGEL